MRKNNINKLNITNKKTCIPNPRIGQIYCSKFNFCEIENNIWRRYFYLSAIRVFHQTVVIGQMLFGNKMLIVLYITSSFCMVLTRCLLRNFAWIPSFVFMVFILYPAKVIDRREKFLEKYLRGLVLLRLVHWKYTLRKLWRWEVGEIENFEHTVDVCEEEATCVSMCTHLRESPFIRHVSITVFYLLINFVI